MKKFVFLVLLLISFRGFAQITTIAPGEYKNINLPVYGTVKDYTRTLILLHEVFDGTLLGSNYAIGTITALRGHSGAWNRLNIAQINSSSAYNTISALLISTDNNAGGWKLKTCRFNNKKYLALDVPYDPSLHDHGYKFTGWTLATGENMLAVVYEDNGVRVNESVLSDIEDYVANNSEIHYVDQFSVIGNVGIGTTSPQEKLSVNGKIRAKEIKVETANWPDYVFEDNYQLPDLKETEDFIKTNKHLPGIPSAKEVAEDGVSLGEMNAKLLKKVEELTLHLIELKKEVELQKSNSK